MSGKTKPWEKNGWILGEQIPGGNQGHTFFARRKEDPEKQFEYVLKRLKRQSDQKLRGRFHIEAESLRTLGKQAISRLVDTNSNDFENTSVDLFVVTDRIRGQSLADLSTRTNPIELSIQIVTGVLKILSQCHESGVIHRDIKPCHVILRNGSPSDPVLIDFGLAFQEEYSVGGEETSLDQGVGNRFILMPEQLYGMKKRDPRSDITQCVGLFYFLLTGQNPGVIYDDSERQPHQKINLTDILESASSGHVTQLNRIFDIGFAHSIDARWQSIDALLQEFEKLCKGESSDGRQDFTERVQAIARESHKRPETQLKVKTEVLLKEFSSQMGKCMQIVSKSAPSLFRIESQAGGVSGQGEGRSNTFSVMNPMNGSTASQVQIEARREGTEVAASAFLNPHTNFGNTTEIDRQILVEKRFGIMDPDGKRLIGEFLEDAWAATFEAIAQ